MLHEQKQHPPPPSKKNPIGLVIMILIYFSKIALHVDLNNEIQNQYMKETVNNTFSENKLQKTILSKY